MSSPTFDRSDARRGLCYARKRGEIGGVTQPRIHLSQAAIPFRKTGPPLSCSRRPDRARRMDRRREREIPSLRLAHRVARPVQGLQPRSGGGHRSGDFGEPVAAIAAREDRARNALPGNCRRKTASADKFEAWNWLVDAATGFYAGGDTQNPRTARRTARRGSSFRVLQTCVELLAPNLDFGRQVAVDLITSADFNENGRCPSHDISPSCGILL